MELRGFEPLTFSLRTRRATNCATAPKCGSNDNTEPERPPKRPERRAATPPSDLGTRPRARPRTLRTASLTSRRSWDLQGHSIAACDCACPACPAPGPTPPTCLAPSWPAAPSRRWPPTTPTARPSGRCRAGSARPASGPGAGWSSAPPRWPLLYLISRLSEVVIPILVALLLAALLQPLYSALTRIVPRGLAAGITVIGTLALVFGMLSFVGSPADQPDRRHDEQGHRGHRPGPRAGLNTTFGITDTQLDGLHRPGARVAQLGQPHRHGDRRRAHGDAHRRRASSSRCSPCTSSSTTARSSGAGWCGSSRGVPARRCTPPGLIAWDAGVGVRPRDPHRRGGRRRRHRHRGGHPRGALRLGHRAARLLRRVHPRRRCRRLGHASPCCWRSSPWGRCRRSSCSASSSGCSRSRPTCCSRSSSAGSCASTPWPSSSRSRPASSSPASSAASSPCRPSPCSTPSATTCSTAPRPQDEVPPGAARTAERGARPRARRRRPRRRPRTSRSAPSWRSRERLDGES